MMNIAQGISSLWQRFLRRKPARAPKIPPEKLPPEILAQALREAEFLRDKHEVKVRSLSEGELPSVPQKAD